MLYNVKWKSLVLSAFCLALLSGSHISRASGPDRGQPSASDEADRNLSRVLRYLAPALNQAGKAGRIYFEESCPSDEYLVYPFPKIEAHPPSKDASGLAAVQQIFKGDTNVTVEENPIGIIRVRVGKVPNEFLQTKMALMTFSIFEQYDASKAFDALLRTKEIQAAMQNFDNPNHGIAISGILRMPEKGVPHLPTSLTNLTLDQSLDTIAQTFGGIVIFGICPSQRWFTVYETGEPGGYVWGNDGYKAMNACENTYEEKYKGYPKVSFAFDDPPFVSVSDSEGYFDVKGVVAYLDKTGNWIKEEVECKIPGKE